MSYLGTLAHGWFDPLFALVILAYPSGRIVGRAERTLAIGFVVVQAAWTVAKAVGRRPIGWWDCPTCIPTVDAWFTAYFAQDPIGRAETLILMALSLGVLLTVIARWLGATGTARRRLAPVVLAGAVLAAGFVVTFMLQTIDPTNARNPFGELRAIVLAILRVRRRDRAAHRRAARGCRARPDRRSRRQPRRPAAVASAASVACGTHWATRRWRCTAGSQPSRGSPMRPDGPPSVRAPMVPTERS